MKWNKRRKELLAIFSSILFARMSKRRSRNVENTVHPKIATGLIKIFCPSFAQIQNEVLERNGFSVRVDHRTLQTQKEKAESNGDTILARLFSRAPEKYIGVISCHENEEPRLERLKIFRGLRKQHFDMVMKMDSMTKEADELEVKDAVQLSSTGAKSLMDSKEYKTQEFISEQKSIRCLRRHW